MRRQGTHICNDGMLNDETIFNDNDMDYSRVEFKVVIDWDQRTVLNVLMYYTGRCLSGHRE